MEFKMNNSKYKILEVSQDELMKHKEQDEGYYYGQTHFIDHEVWIDKDLPYERKKRTLYHELTHVYIREYLTTRDIEPDEEVLCDISANSHDIIHSIVDAYFNRINILYQPNNLGVIFSPYELEDRIVKKNMEEMNNDKKRTRK